MGRDAVYSGKSRRRAATASHTSILLRVSEHHSALIPSQSIAGNIFSYILHL
jgi:hypothetical protein